MKCSKISRFIILYFPISVKVWYHITIPGDRGRFSVSFRKINKINYCEKETENRPLSPRERLMALDGVTVACITHELNMKICGEIGRAHV